MKFLDLLARTAGTVLSSFPRGSRIRHFQAIALTGLALSCFQRTTFADCLLTGPSVVCAGSTNTYFAARTFTNGFAFYSWEITSNSAGAVIVGPANNSSVQVAIGSSGSYELSCAISGGPGSVNYETCATTVQVKGPPGIVCPAGIAV